MDALTLLRRQRAWTVAALFLCLPWMVVCGKGACHVQVKANVPAATCSHCCPTAYHAAAPAPSAPKPLPCCEAFKLYLNSEAALPKIGLEEIGVAVPWHGGIPLFTLASSEPPPFPGNIHSSEVPPGAFLRTVSRCCHPGNAPPSALAS